jgi:hypothetical protein
MIAEASWKDRQRNVGGKMVETKRGQLAASSRFLAKAWDWSEPKVRRFLEALENRRMVTRVTDAGLTVITLCNYERYQSVGRVGDAGPTQDPTQDRRTTDANEKKGERKKKEEEAGRARATEPKAEVIPLRVVASQADPEPDDQALLRMVLEAAEVSDYPLPHRWMPTTAATHVGNWRRGLGLTATQIVDAIRLNRQARPNLGPARGPSAFDRMLAEYAAARLAPLPSVPEVTQRGPVRASPPDQTDHLKALFAQAVKERRK